MLLEICVCSLISFAHNIKYLYITKFKSYDDPDSDDGKNENFEFW